MSTDSLPRMHQREWCCISAVNDLSAAILEIAKKHGLTRFEEIRVVNEACSGCLASIAKYGIREERHGNADKPGGID